MSSSCPTTDFYRPDIKELGFGICYVLEQAGGCLSQQRVNEVLADHFQIPEIARNVPRGDPTSSETVWSYMIAWSTTRLRNEGFMDRNNSRTRGLCMLTEHGRDLGRWAGRVYAGENPVLPDWVAAFLQPVRGRIKDLLKGGEHKTPPDYELCRWVRYCYLLDLPEHGVAVFNRILSDNVEPGLYRQAERQARILRGRLNERGADVCETPEYAQVRPWILKLRKPVREWVVSEFPVGTRVGALGGDGDYEIRAVTRAGVSIVSGTASFSDLISWQTLAFAVVVLLKAREVRQDSLPTHGDFVCSLLAHFPGAAVVPGDCAVRFVGDQSAELDRD